MKILHNIKLEDVINDGIVIHGASPFVDGGDIEICSDKVEYKQGDKIAHVRTRYFKCLATNESFTNKLLDDLNLDNIKDALRKVNK